MSSFIQERETSDLQEWEPTIQIYCIKHTADIWKITKTHSIDFSLQYQGILQQSQLDPGYKNFQLFEFLYMG